jgi:DNA modification methylase
VTSPVRLDLTLPWQVIESECRAAMALMSEASVDSIVTDPPYGLAFMGKEWDHGVPGVAFWAEALRVAKPGAHLLAFGGTRTFHRLTCAIEDAGWEIRDCVMWVYGSGFPKSLDVSKAIDKEAGAVRTGEKPYIAPDGKPRPTVVSDWGYSGERGGKHTRRVALTSAPASDLARQWDGWGTALKPAWEPIIVARKPLIGTVAANVTQHGTGALNIDGCRVDGDDDTSRRNNGTALGMMNDDGWKPRAMTTGGGPGRWPANIVHDGSDGALARFFYCAKASREEREQGLEGMVAVRGGSEVFDPNNRDGVGPERMTLSRNHHPTVKPLDLMRWLCRLVTPPGGLVLDPFTGSGSTGCAAVEEGFRFVGLEMEPAYVAIARRRIADAAAQTRLAL